MLTKKTKMTMSRRRRRIVMILQDFHTWYWSVPEMDL